VNSPVCGLQYIPFHPSIPPINESPESYHDAAKNAEADRATEQQGAKEKSEREATRKLEEQELIVFRKVHVQTERTYEETLMPTKDETVTRPTSSTTAIPNPPNKLHGRTEPQTERNYEKTPTPTKHKEATRPTSRTSAIPNPPNEAHGRTEPHQLQQLVNDPRTISDYEKPFSKPDNIYTWWVCHGCGHWLPEAFLICLNCNHEQCIYCSIAHSKYSGAAQK
jgi:hypothetical protein